MKKLRPKKGLPFQFLLLTLQRAQSVAQFLQMSFSSASNIRVLGWIIGFAVLFIGSRLYFLQIVRADELSERADRSFALQQSVFNRGSIFFTTKNGERAAAASLKSGFSLIIDAGLLKDPESTFNEISRFLPLKKEDFLSAVSKGSGSIEIYHKISQENADNISALKLSGVNLVREKWRFYPGNERASHILGFVGYDGESLVGRYGLERYYEDILLRGKSSPYTNFFGELVGLAGSKEKLAGDITAGIEPAAQSFLEESINKVQKKFSSKETAGIIMNPKNGEIIAMAATPSFDPNNFQKEKDWRVFVNPLVENVYEFGSIVKPITIASGIDSGVITPDSTYNDEGSLTLDGKTIYNFDKKGRGIVSMQEVLNQSLNTGASFVALKLGTKKFSDYLFYF
jgi:cell division protein FtsI/penicillin-binding protein 2